MDKTVEIKEQGEELATVQQRIAELESQQAEHQRTEQVQAALYRIAETTSAVADMHEFYAALHQIVGELMYAKNFFIALYNATTGLIEFPYWVDEMDPQPQPTLLAEQHGVTGWVLRHGRSLADVDGSWAAAKSAGEVEVYGTEAIVIAVPLLNKEKTLGVLVVQSYTSEHSYTLQDLELLNFVAQHIAAALERARLLAETRRLLEETQQRNAELSIINSIQAGLVAELEMQAIFELVGEKIRTIFDAQVAIIATYDYATEQANYRYVFEKGNRFDGVIIPFNGFHREMIRTGKTILFNENLAAQVKPLGFAESFTPNELPKSALNVPLLAGDQVLGHVALENLDNEYAFSESDVRLLETLANSMSVALENARLYSAVQAARLAAETTSRELTQTLNDLKNTQRQLIEAEKMAALGGLVAGVAHEINTPVGIGVTAASLLEDKTTAFREIYQNGQMKRSDLEKYLDTASQSSTMILNNLYRAAELIQSFKQVAVDQSSEERRSFKVREYLEEILLSLHPKLKRTQHRINIEGTDDLVLDSYPGAFSQIVTNLVMNSLIHAYGPDEAGQLTFDLKQKNKRLVFEYGDDGRGIPQEHLKKIFDPFFTTKRGHGGSGLGLHIIYNLVTQKLGGTIRCESEVGSGTRFVIDLPLERSTTNGN